MDAANPLCRCLMLAAGLLAVIGCESGGGPKYRGQMPQDPLAPIAPPPMPPTPNAPYTPIAPIAPTAPMTPTAPSGVVPAIPVSPAAPITGSPVPPDAKGPISPVVYTSTGAKNFPNATELIKQSVPRVKVVAIVGANNVVTDLEVDEAVMQHHREYAKLEGYAQAAKKKELYAVMLRKTIQRELILDDMYAKLKKANKMNVIDEIKDGAAQMAEKQARELKKEVRGDADAKSMTDADFEFWLRVQGLTLPVLKRQWEREIMAQQYIQGVLKEKGRRAGLGEVRDYYDKHQDEFKTPDRVKWQHIFISYTKHATPQAAYAYAEAIRQNLAAGADFAATSMQYDNGLAAGQKGFGVGEKPNEIAPAELADTILNKLKPGQMSGLIQTPTGYHIVKVLERDYAGVRPFDPKLQAEIREKLNKKYFDEDEAKMIEELWRKGTVRVIEE